jgi:hypothetical protein
MNAAPPVAPPAGRAALDLRSCRAERCIHFLSATRWPRRGIMARPLRADEAPRRGHRMRRYQVPRPAAPFAYTTLNHFDPTGRTLAFGSFDGETYLWRVERAAD